MKQKLLFLLTALCFGLVSGVKADVLETVGSTNCDSEWWKVFSTGNYSVSRGEGRHIRFINHNSGTSTNNWWNWIVGLNSKQDRSGTEFCIIRSDNYGWDSNIMNYYCNYNWTDYNTKMNGATVDMYIYYKGTNVFINNLITTNETTPSTWTYNISLYNITVDEVFPFFIADHSYIDVTLSEKVEIPNTIPDYSTIGCKTWQVWTEATNTRTINSGESYHFRFKNYYIGSNAWENFLIKGHQLTKNPSTEAYDIVTNKFAMRADYYDDVKAGQCTNNFGSADLSQVYANGATVDAVVTYNANKTATVRADITTADGDKYYEEEVITLDGEGLPLYIKPAVNGAYLEMMQESATYTVAASSANTTMGSAAVTSGASEGVANAGASVTVTATPNDGYRFVNWTEGGDVVSTDAAYTYTALDNRSLVANFVQVCSYTVNAIDGSSNVLYEIATGSADFGSSVTIAYDAFYLKSNGDLLQADRIDNGKKEYRYTFNVDEDNKELTVTYKTTSYSNIVFYREAEDIATLTEVASGNVPARCSGAKAAYAASDAVITTLGPGKYKLSSFAWGIAGTELSVYAGENLIKTFTTAASTLNITTSEEFTLETNTDIIFKTGGNGSSSPKVLDFFFIQKTAVPATIGANGFATFASEYPLDMTIENMPDGVRAFTASITGNTVSFTKLDQTVPANTGVLLASTDAMKGETVQIPVVANGDPVENNRFIAGTGAELPEDDANYYFALNKNKPDLTFGKFNQTSVVINADKAYFKVAKNDFGSGARLVINFDDVTGINTIEAAEPEANALKEGKFLENGKIVIVKNGVKYGVNGQKLN